MRRPAAPEHHRLAEKKARTLWRQGIEDRFQGRRVRHTAVTLTVHEFRLDSQGSGFGKKVHSARGLHATGGIVAKLSKYRKEIGRA
ncbi:MAG TPA: hypothetical protein VJS63_11840 [Bradyrhizobium sp.]|nr:hypothetical protein [Bradyrhizobium sp.]